MIEYADALACLHQGLSKLNPLEMMQKNQITYKKEMNMYFMSLGILIGKSSIPAKSLSVNSGFKSMMSSITTLNKNIQ